ncbi:MAG TPA: gamma-glutamyltransferase [Gemmatimonadaceae bacterium]|nr:gamma-glutamyltransferase [Gemmatimonadaceae bacterium]
MVASPHSLASAAGLSILRRGGSAVDAAIATAAVLGTVYPHMTGIGGDGFWLVHDPRSPRTRGLNASGPAARLASVALYRSLSDGRRIPERGPNSALTVPGAVDGWRAAHERFGRLAWDELLADAIRYAEEGAPVGRSLGRWMAAHASRLHAHPDAARVFLPGKRPPREGERLAQPALAATLRLIARDGARAFYEGALPERICDALAACGSPLRAGDFAAYAAEWVEPIASAYRGLLVQEMPPNTQGLSALLILGMLEGFDVAAWGDDSADYYHHLAEAARLASADRDAWCADPRFSAAPLRELLDPRYAAERGRRIDPAAALPASAIAPGLAHAPPARAARVGGDTCYVAVVDADGMVVSMIESLYLDFGSCVMAGDTGVLLQNRGALFSLREEDANVLHPGKRPFHTIIPALALRDGAPWLAFGSMGGNGQPQTHAALVTRLVDFGYDVQRAIEAPRWVMGRTLTSADERLWLEGRVSRAAVRELRRRGHPVRVLEDWSEAMGHAQAIRIHCDTGLLEGGADPRGDGAAVGY